jgi:hypothetical protein
MFRESCTSQGQRGKLWFILAQLGASKFELHSFRFRSTGAVMNTLGETISWMSSVEESELSSQTILMRRPWSVDAPTKVVALDPNDRIPKNELEGDFAYFLELFVLAEALEGRSDLSLRKKCLMNDEVFCAAGSNAARSHLAHCGAVDAANLKRPCAEGDINGRAGGISNKQHSVSNRKCKCIVNSRGKLRKDRLSCSALFAKFDEQSNVYVERGARCTPSLKRYSTDNAVSIVEARSRALPSVLQTRTDSSCLRKGCEQHCAHEPCLLLYQSRQRAGNSLGT